MKRLGLAGALVCAAGFLAALPGLASASVQVGSSGWQWGNPLPQGNAVRAMSFAGATGYAAGDFGTLLRTTDVVAAAGALLEPDDVADAVVDGLRDERFLILPHPEVMTFLRRKVDDHERWLAGMRRLQARVDGVRGSGPAALPRDPSPPGP